MAMAGAVVNGDAGDGGSGDDGGSGNGSCSELPLGLC